MQGGDFAATPRQLAAKRGRVVHRAVGSYHGDTDEGCDRFLIVNGKVLLLLDDDGTVLPGPVDPYGRIHFEEFCPSPMMQRFIKKSKGSTR